MSLRTLSKRLNDLGNSSWSAIPFKLYLLGPTVIFWFGAFLNQLVIYVNQGVMPVMFPPGECPPSTDDGIHTCMTAASHLKVLSDIINLSNAIMSIGDVCIYLGAALVSPAFLIWVVLVVVEINILRKGSKNGIFSRHPRSGS